MKIIIPLLILMVFMSYGFASECNSDVKAWLTLDDAQRAGGIAGDICGSSGFTEINTPTTGQTGKFGESYSFSSASSEYLINTTDFVGAFPFSVSYWFKTSTSGANMAVWSVVDVSEPDVFFSSRQSSNVGSPHEVYGKDTGASEGCLTGDLDLDNGNWHYGTIVFYNSTNWEIFINATSECNASVTVNYLAGIDNWDIGRLGDSTPISYWNGYIDEFVIFSKALNQTEINNLFNYNNITGIILPSGSASVILNYPADGDHDNNVTWRYTPTWTSPIFKTCNLFVNNTLRSTNSTSLVNNTINNLTWTPISEGNWSWFVGCNFTNGTFVNSTSRTFVYDTTIPTVSIFSPSNNSIFKFRTNENLNVSANDTNMYNLTCDINYLNGTTVKSITNDTGTPPIFTLNSEFISSLNQETDSNISYYMNCSAKDSHTGLSDNGNIISSNKSDIKLYNGNGLKVANVKNNESFLTKVDIDKLTDRQKITYTFNKSITSFTEVLYSQCPIYIIENSSYAGHLIFCNRWYDAESAKNQGWKITTKRINEKTVSLTYTHKTGLKVIDPATGGLNLGFDTAYFKVIPNSNISITSTTFYKTQEGYLLIYYDNSTDSDLIAGSTCSYNLTDPYANSYNGYSASEYPNFYRANYTPTFSGTYSYSIICEKTNWTTQIITGSFNVLANSASTAIQLQVQSGDDSTKRTCVGNNAQIQVNKTACIESDCVDTAYISTENCEFGCYRGYCNQAPENYTIYLLIASVIVLLILIGIGLS